METYLTEVVRYLLAQSWQIAVLTVIVAFATFLLKNRSAHVRYLLWLIILAKCLTPPLLTMPLAILPEGKPTMAPEPAGITVVKTPEVSSATIDIAPVPKRVNEMNEKPPEIAIHEWPGITWLIGAVIYLVLNLLRALRANCWLWAGRRALPSDLRESIENSLATYGFRKLPRIWLIDNINQPFVWGLLRGGIYMPSSFANIDGDEHRRNILGHELSHIIRFDAAVNFLQVIAQAIFWFHPFVWWANKRIRSEREKCCDEMAIARLGAQAKDYSNTIVKVLATKHKSTRPVPSLAIAGPAKNIEKRIKTMLRPGKKFYKRPSLVAATIVLLLASLTVPTALVLTARAETKTPAEHKEKSAKALHEAAANCDIEQVKSLISKGYDVNEPDPNGLTPLHLAAKHGHKIIVELLIAEGTDVDAKPKGRVVNWRKGTTPLHEASKHGHKDVAEVLIAHGADVNAKNWSGFTPLYNAAASGHKELAEWLVVKGADVDAALYCAAEHGHSSAVKLLLAKGANVDVEDEEGFTALHVAAVLGHKDVIELLIDKGANVNAKDKDGVTPIYTAITSIGLEKKRMVDVVNLLQDKGAQIDTIHLAAFVGDMKKVNTLLKQGTDVNAKDKDGRTPLHLAVISGQKDVIELLIDKGAEVNAKTEVKDSSLINPPGLTPLHLAVIYPDYEVAKLLIENGADINAKTESFPFNVTPLWMPLITIGLRMEIMFFDQDADLDIFDSKEADAILQQFIGTYWSRLRTVIELLLEQGANVNEKGLGGMTPLHLVASVGLTDAAELLIAHGAEVNTKNNEGQTPLHLIFDEDLRGIDIDKEGTAKLLIANGADVNTKDNKGGTALWYAKDQGYTEIAEILIKHGAKEIAPKISLHRIVTKGDIEQVKSLIEKGADVNAKDDNGQTPLHLAAQSGYRDMVKLLVTKGADIYAKAEGQWGNTPLHSAASSGRKEIVELLLASGTNVDVRNRVGDTPLRCACYGDHVNVMGILLGKDANIEAEDRWGRTPLHIAAEHHSPDAVKLLLARGADVNAGIPSGNTPLHRAIMSGDTEIAGLLLAKGADLSAREHGYTPVALAMWKDQKEMVRFLMGKGAKFSEVHVAAYFDELDEVNQFLSDGGNVDARDPSGLTLIHSAICGGNRQIIESLIAKGANVNAQDSSGWAPLHMASAAGREQITKLLLAGGANLGLCDKSGRTALHWAAMKNHKTIVEMLLSKGSNVNARTGSIIAEGEKDGGWTPLHQACAGGHKDVVEVLIDHGADIGARTENGDTALSVAKKEYELKRMPIHRDVMEILRKHGAK
jgi:ankyrin repeat protein/beta-lactamase regulating signal transducer with metallopeptidase domain